MSADEDVVESADTMTLTEHLGELRVRIIRSALAISIGMVLIIAFYDQVLDFLLQPYVELCERKPADFCDPTLNTFSPTEGIATRMRVGMYGGIIARAARAVVADLAVHRSGAQRQGEEVRGPVRPVVDRAVRRGRHTRVPHASAKPSSS